MSYMKNYPPKPGSGRAAPIVDQAMIIDIQVLINKTEPADSCLPPLDTNGHLDNATVERLWQRYGDVRNLAEADLTDPENAKLAKMPQELRTVIIHYQGAAPTREARELRNERFSLPTAFREASEAGKEAYNTPQKPRDSASHNQKQSFMKTPLFAQIMQLEKDMPEALPQATSFDTMQ